METKKKQNMTEDIESLTIHGLSKVAAANSKITRLTWITLFVCSFMVLGFMAIKSIIKYYQYEIAVKTENRPKSPFPLPAITFCQTNYYHPMTYAAEVPVFQHFPESCHKVTKETFPNTINKLYFYYACTAFFGWFDAKTSAMGTDTPQYFQFPHKFSFLPHVYPCFTLNRNSTLLQYSAGENQGLNMILYDKPLTEEMFLYDVKHPLEDKRKGLSVFIHDPKQHVAWTGGILTPPGFHTHIAIKRVIKKRLPSPYPSKCIKDSEQDKESIFSGKNNDALCWVSCFFKKVYADCQGVFLEMRPFMKPPKYPKIANYSDPNFFKCVNQSLRSFGTFSCNYCKPLCYEEMYKTQVNRNPWPQKWQTSTLSHIAKALSAGKNITEEEIQQGLLKVSVYYEDMAEEVSEERQIYDLSAIASDFGGQMGLFLGASLLSVAEILALGVNCLKKKLFRRNLVHKFSNP